MTILELNTIKKAKYKIANWLRRLTFLNIDPFLYHWKTQLNLRNNQNKTIRKLEIGPGPNRIPSFETINIVNGNQVDYVLDAAKPLPFLDGAFDLIYASHILEHIPWYQTETTLREWVRVLKKGGVLEVWVPDGLKICQAFVDAELHHDNSFGLDGWYRFNPEKDPCKWAAGRLFTYGDGAGNLQHANWHRAIFSSRYLQSLFVAVGLKQVKTMESNEVRGADRGWINLGVKGIKP